MPTSSPPIKPREQRALRTLMPTCFHVRRYRPLVFPQSCLLHTLGTGSQPTGVACKSPTTQINEFLKVISDNNVIVQRLWFDIEPTSGVCNAWQLSKSANEALAKDWVAALKATGLKWGIYANG